MAAAFTPEHRLRAKRDFDYVFARPKRSSSRFFSVLARRSEHQQARLGLAVSRKVDARAVGRNRIKRTVRESFRHCASTLPAIDVIVIARPDAKRATKLSLRRALEQHWRDLIRLTL